MTEQPPAHAQAAHGPGTPAGMNDLSGGIVHTRGWVLAQQTPLPYEPQGREVSVTTTTTGEYTMAIPVYDEMPLLFAVQAVGVAMVVVVIVWLSTLVKPSQYAPKKKANN